MQMSSINLSAVLKHSERDDRKPLFIFQTPQSNQAVCVLLLPDAGRDVKCCYLPTGRRNSPHREGNLSQADLKIVDVHCFFQGNNYFRVSCTHTHSVGQLRAMQRARIQTKIQHKLSHLLFNISASLLSSA